MDFRPREAASFTALDFETANRYRNSACAIGLVKVERGVVVERAYHLIRPPFAYFEFTHIHNIDWSMVRYEPTFAELWPRLGPFFEGVDFLAAHNAPFDKGVLSAVCAHYMLKAPELEYRCTVRMARTAWN
ncbi:exonuclease, partial [bacterium]